MSSETSAQRTNGEKAKTTKYASAIIIGLILSIAQILTTRYLLQFDTISDNQNKISMELLSVKKDLKVVEASLTQLTVQLGELNKSSVLADIRHERYMAQLGILDIAIKRLSPELK